jgi:transposase
VVAGKLEQFAAVKFSFLLEKTAGKTFVMLETAYREAALGKTQVYEWFSRFRNGELSLADQPRSGRPSTSRTDEKIARICALILEDRQISFLTVKLLTNRFTCKFCNVCVKR